MATSRKKYIYIVQVTRQLSIDIINNFIKQGKEVHLVTGVIESNYAPLDPSVKVTRFTKHNPENNLKRTLSWMLFSVCCFFYILLKGRKKELILVSTPPFILFLGWIFKKIYHTNYHLIIWDLYPDVLVNMNIASKNSMVIKFWEWLNARVFNEAANIFTLGKHLAKAIKEYTSKDPVVIANWVNMDFIKPLKKSENTFVIKHKLNDKFIVMYSGNLGLTHNIESIVNTAAYLKVYNDIQFVIIGEGAKKNKIAQMIADKNLSNVLMLPYQDKEILPFSLSCADIGIVTLSEGAESVSVPSKTYYTLAAGSVILALASKQSELALLIDKYNCGKIFDSPDAVSVANFILSLKDDNLKLNEYKLNSRNASFDFSPKNAEKYFSIIINPLC